MLYLRRGLLGLCLATGGWALVIAASGGFLFRIGSLRVSSRDPSTATVIAVLSGLIVVALRFVPAARTTAQDEWTWWQTTALAVGRRVRPLLIPSVAIAIAGAVLEVLLWQRAPPLWADEEMIALNVRDRSLLELPGRLWLGQSAPFGWLVLQRGVLLALGAAEMTLRLVPLLFGIGTLAAAAWVGQRWMTRAGAALLVALCAFGPWLSYFPFELKHYSADAFWALLLPALAARALDSRETGPNTRRLMQWWVIASIGLWFGNGALFVTPGCVVVLFGTILRRHGVRAGVRFAATGLIWAASAGAHYVLAIESAHRNRYLRTYWADSVPGDSLGVLQTLGWIAERLDPLALNPAGAASALAFWICIAAGFATTRHRILALLFATVPLSSFALAALRLLPMHERLALWIVPALYVGVALLIDTGARLALSAWRVRQPLRMVPGVLLAALSLSVGADIVSRGTPILDLAPRTTNHGLDDRTAASFLMGQRQPGDAIISTPLGWPALWWYGSVSMRDVPLDGRLPDGTGMYEVLHGRTGACGPSLRVVLPGHRRALLHIGFPDMPPGFFDLVVEELKQLGTVVYSRRFADSLIAVADLGEPSTTGPPDDLPLKGCAGVRPARRW